MTIASKDRTELLVRALSLSDADRAKLAQELVDSLPSDYAWGDHMKPDLREEWITEARRRIAEIDSGETELIDGSEVMQRLREKFGA
ncbi:MAG: addiction module protein [Planctomycetaceae bacterium]|nr:addiction module protein [Planctomycetaceae bacterium]